MRRGSLILVILLATGALAFVSAPWFAMRALQAAARDGDAQALAELIDYPAVRAGFRNAGPEVLEAPPNVWNDPIGAVRRAIEGRRPAPPALERNLTPLGLQRLAGEPRLRHRAQHWGPNRVRFVLQGEAGESRFTWQRRGLFRWKLVSLLPPPVSAGFRDEDVRRSPARP